MSIQVSTRDNKTMLPVQNVTTNGINTPHTERNTFVPPDCERLRRRLERLDDVRRELRSIPVLLLLLERLLVLARLLVLVRLLLTRLLVLLRLTDELESLTRRLLRYSTSTVEDMLLCDLCVLWAEW
jgi:hypothetical protein